VSSVGIQKVVHLLNEWRVEAFSWYSCSLWLSVSKAEIRPMPFASVGQKLMS
jgi:hypothetical protein